MGTMSLSARQADIVRHAASDATTLLAGGAVRSGKSFAVLNSFAVWLVAQEESHDHAIVGQSIEAIMRNLGFDFIDAVGRIRGARARIDKSFGTRILVEGRAPQSVWIIGANDAKARRRIQGSTLKGLVVEELPLLPQDFFFMAWSRLSVDGAKMWASYNPEGPAHWAKKKVVDRPQDFGGEVVQFRMRDNPTLSEDVIARYERSFTGHFYQRYIAGEWAAASGACYPRWSETEAVPDFPTWHLALDWAVSGTMAALMIASRGREAVVVSELYHEGRTEGLLTEDQVAEQHRRVVAGGASGHDMWMGCTRLGGPEHAGDLQAAAAENMASCVRAGRQRGGAGHRHDRPRGSRAATCASTPAACG